MPPSPLLSARITKRMYLIGDDQRQRPEDQRQHAEHVVARRRDAVRAVETLAQRVERARADVAVDDAERAEGEQAETGRVLGMRAGRVA